MSGTSILILEDEEKLVIVDGVVIARAVSRLCKRADALLSLNLVRVEEERFRLIALCLVTTRVSSQVCRV